MSEEFKYVKKNIELSPFVDGLESMLEAAVEKCLANRGWQGMGSAPDDELIEIAWDCAGRTVTDRCISSESYYALAWRPIEKLPTPEELERLSHA